MSLSPEELRQRLNTFKVQELRTLATHCGVRGTGKKAELIGRLCNADMSIVAQGVDAMAGRYGWPLPSGEPVDEGPGSGVAAAVAPPPLVGPLANSRAAAKINRTARKQPRSQHDGISGQPQHVQSQAKRRRLAKSGVSPLLGSSDSLADHHGAIETNEQCLCRGTPQPSLYVHQRDGVAAASSVLCPKCHMAYHRCCVALGASEELPPGFICPRCRVLDVDPFYPTRMILHVLPLWDDLSSSDKVMARRKLPLHSPNVHDLRKRGSEVFLFCLKLRRCWNYPRLHEWPLSVTVTVNKNTEQVTKPEYEHKRRDVPIKVTPYLSSEQQNNIEVTAINFEDKDPYFIALALCDRKLPDQLFKEINATRRLSFEAARAKAMDTIHRFFGKGTEAEDIDILDTSCRLRLICPISLSRIEVPVRGSDCQHFQCFDLKSFIDVTRNTKAFGNRWKCVECNKFIRPKDLVVDTCVEHILKSTSSDTEAVIFKEDGSWDEQTCSWMAAGDDVGDEEDAGGSVIPSGVAAGGGPSTIGATGLRGGIELVAVLDSSDEEEEAVTARPVAYSQTSRPKEATDVGQESLSPTLPAPPAAISPTHPPTVVALSGEEEEESPRETTLLGEGEARPVPIDLPTPVTGSTPTTPPSRKKRRVPEEEEGAAASLEAGEMVDEEEPEQLIKVVPSPRADGSTHDASIKPSPMPAELAAMFELPPVATAPHAPSPAPASFASVQVLPPPRTPQRTTTTGGTSTATPSAREPGPQPEVAAGPPVSRPSVAVAAELEEGEVAGEASQQPLATTPDFTGVVSRAGAGEDESTASPRTLQEVGARPFPTSPVKPADSSAVGAIGRLPTPVAAPSRPVVIAPPVLLAAPPVKQMAPASPPGGSPAGKQQQQQLLVVLAPPTQQQSPAGKPRGPIVMAPPSVQPAAGAQAVGAGRRQASPATADGVDRRFPRGRSQPRRGTGQAQAPQPGLFRPVTLPGPERAGATGVVTGQAAGGRRGPLRPPVSLGGFVHPPPPQPQQDGQPPRQPPGSPVGGGQQRGATAAVRYFSGFSSAVPIPQPAQQQQPTVVQPPTQQQPITVPPQRPGDGSGGRWIERQSQQHAGDGGSFYTPPPGHRPVFPQPQPPAVVSRVSIEFNPTAQRQQLPPQPSRQQPGIPVRWEETGGPRHSYLFNAPGGNFPPEQQLQQLQAVTPVSEQPSVSPADYSLPLWDIHGLVSQQQQQLQPQGTAAGVPSSGGRPVPGGGVYDASHGPAPQAPTWQSATPMGQQQFYPAGGPLGAPPLEGAPWMWS